ncbi:Os02g0166501 [Oryza sativa Japonica Group]|jgi:hypothetical protein|nr:hypothetical protein EE612_009066 [Oryza sativa]BAS77153.1 Os02g0166501 [Oryza sativa Japonica Group]
MEPAGGRVVVAGGGGGGGRRPSGVLLMLYAAGGILILNSTAPVMNSHVLAIMGFYHAMWLLGCAIFFAFLG